VLHSVGTHADAKDARSQTICPNNHQSVVPLYFISSRHTLDQKYWLYYRKSAQAGLESSLFKR